MANQNLKEPQAQQNVVEAVSRTEEFFNENKKAIYGCLIALVVIGLGILAYSKFYAQPRKAEAAAQMFRAEQNFAEGNYELALNGDDNYPGFTEIASRYGKMAGKAVYLYEGISNLQTGNFEEAIKALKKYNGKDNILLGRAQACIGDAYVGREDYKSALGWFQKAAKTSGNMFSATYLLKAGVTAEALEDNQTALSCYKQIKDAYPQSPEAMDIDKYISRIETAE